MSSVAYAGIDGYLNFNIPKVKRKPTKDNLTPLDLNSRDAKDILSTVERSYLQATYKGPWKLVSVDVVVNKALEEQYRQRRLELKNEGRHSKELVDQFAYLACKDQYVATSVAKNGIQAKARKDKLLNSLGNSKSGVSLWRHADVQLGYAETYPTVTSCKLIVFKVMLGKCKAVQGCYGTETVIEPTPNYDCHICAISAKPQDPFYPRLMRSQVYFYEYDDEALPAECPRQCLPHAILTYERPKSCAPKDYFTVMQPISRLPPWANSNSWAMEQSVDNKYPFSTSAQQETPLPEMLPQDCQRWDMPVSQDGPNSSHLRLDPQNSQGHPLPDALFGGAVSTDGRPAYQSQQSWQQLNTADVIGCIGDGTQPAYPQKQPLLPVPAQSCPVPGAGSSEWSSRMQPQTFSTHLTRVDPRTAKFRVSTQNETLTIFSRQLSNAGESQVLNNYSHMGYAGGLHTANSQFQNTATTIMTLPPNDGSSQMLHNVNVDKIKESLTDSQVQLMKQVRDFVYQQSSDESSPMKNLGQDNSSSNTGQVTESNILVWGKKTVSREVKRTISLDSYKRFRRVKKQNSALATVQPIANQENVSGQVTLNIGHPEVTRVTINNSAGPTAQSVNRTDDQSFLVGPLASVALSTATQQSCSVARTEGTPVNQQSYSSVTPQSGPAISVYEEPTSKGVGGLSSNEHSARLGILRNIDDCHQESLNVEEDPVTSTAASLNECGTVDATSESSLLAIPTCPNKDPRAVKFLSTSRPSSPCSIVSVSSGCSMTSSLVGGSALSPGSSEISGLNSMTNMAKKKKKVNRDLIGYKKRRKRKGGKKSQAKSTNANKFNMKAECSALDMLDDCGDNVNLNVKPMNSRNLDNIVTDDTEIDYTDFSFDHPHEFEMSIPNELGLKSPLGTTEISSPLNKVPDFSNPLVTLPPSQTTYGSDEKGRLWNDFDLHHWTQALADPRFQPTVLCKRLMKFSARNVGCYVSPTTAMEIMGGDLSAGAGAGAGVEPERLEDDELRGFTPGPLDIKLSAIEAGTLEDGEPVQEGELGGIGHGPVNNRELSGIEQGSVNDCELSGIEQGSVKDRELSGIEQRPVENRELSGIEQGPVKNRELSGNEQGSAEDCELSGIDQGPVENRELSGIEQGSVKDRELSEIEQGSVEDRTLSGIKQGPVEDRELSAVEPCLSEEVEVSGSDPEPVNGELRTMTDYEHSQSYIESHSCVEVNLSMPKTPVYVRTDAGYLGTVFRSGSKSLPWTNPTSGHNDHSQSHSTILAEPDEITRALSSRPWEDLNQSDSQAEATVEAAPFIHVIDTDTSSVGSPGTGLIIDLSAETDEAINTPCVSEEPMGTASSVGHIVDQHAQTTSFWDSSLYISEELILSSSNTAQEIKPKYDEGSFILPCNTYRMPSPVRETTASKPPEMKDLLYSAYMSENPAASQLQSAEETTAKWLGQMAKLCRPKDLFEQKTEDVFETIRKTLNLKIPAGSATPFPSRQASWPASSKLESAKSPLEKSPSIKPSTKSPLMKDAFENRLNALKLNIPAMSVIRQSSMPSFIEQDSVLEPKPLLEEADLHGDSLVELSTELSTGEETPTAVQSELIVVTELYDPMEPTEDDSPALSPSPARSQNRQQGRLNKTIPVLDTQSAWPNEKRCASSGTTKQVVHLTNTDTSTDEQGQEDMEICSVGDSTDIADVNMEAKKPKTDDILVWFEDMIKPKDDRKQRKGLSIVFQPGNSKKRNASPRQHSDYRAKSAPGLAKVDGEGTVDSKSTKAQSMQARSTSDRNALRKKACKSSTASPGRVFESKTLADLDSEREKLLRELDGLRNSDSESVAGSPHVSLCGSPCATAQSILHNNSQSPAACTKGDRSRHSSSGSLGHEIRKSSVASEKEETPKPVRLSLSPVSDTESHRSLGHVDDETVKENKTNQIMDSRSRNRSPIERTSRSPRPLHSDRDSQNPLRTCHSPQFASKNENYPMVKKSSSPQSSKPDQRSPPDKDKKRSPLRTCRRSPSKKDDKTSVGSSLIVQNQSPVHKRQKSRSPRLSWRRSQSPVDRIRKSRSPWKARRSQSPTESRERNKLPCLSGRRRSSASRRRSQSPRKSRSRSRSRSKSKSPTASRRRSSSPLIPRRRSESPVTRRSRGSPQPSRRRSQSPFDDIWQRRYSWISRSIGLPLMDSRGRRRSSSMSSSGSFSSSWMSTTPSMSSSPDSWRKSRSRSRGRSRSPVMSRWRSRSRSRSHTPVDRIRRSRSSRTSRSRRRSSVTDKGEKSTSPSRSSHRKNSLPDKTMSPTRHSSGRRNSRLHNTDMTQSRRRSHSKHRKKSTNKDKSPVDRKSEETSKAKGLKYPEVLKRVQENQDFVEQAVTSKVSKGRRASMDWMGPASQTSVTQAGENVYHIPTMTSFSNTRFDSWKTEIPSRESIRGSNIKVLHEGTCENDRLENLNVNESTGLRPVTKSHSAVVASMWGDIISNTDREKQERMKKQNCGASRLSSSVDTKEFWNLDAPSVATMKTTNSRIDLYAEQCKEALHRIQKSKEKQENQRKEFLNRAPLKDWLTLHIDASHPRFHEFLREICRTIGAEDHSKFSLLSKGQRRKANATAEFYSKLIKGSPSFPKKAVHVGGVPIGNSTTPSESPATSQLITCQKVEPVSTWHVTDKTTKSGGEQTSASDEVSRECVPIETPSESAVTSKLKSREKQDRERVEFLSRSPLKDWLTLYIDASHPRFDEILQEICQTIGAKENSKFSLLSVSEKDKIRKTAEYYFKLTGEYNSKLFKESRIYAEKDSTVHADSVSVGKSTTPIASPATSQSIPCQKVGPVSTQHITDKTTKRGGEQTSTSDEVCRKWSEVELEVTRRCSQCGRNPELNTTAFVIQELQFVKSLLMKNKKYIKEYKTHLNFLKFNPNSFRAIQADLNTIVFRLKKLKSLPPWAREHFECLPSILDLINSVIASVENLPGCKDEDSCQMLLGVVMIKIGQSTSPLCGTLLCAANRLDNLKETASIQSCAQCKSSTDGKPLEPEAHGFEIEPNSATNAILPELSNLTGEKSTAVLAKICSHCGGNLDLTMVRFTFEKIKMLKPNLLNVRKRLKSIRPHEFARLSFPDVQTCMLQLADEVKILMSLPSHVIKSLPDQCLPKALSMIDNTLDDTRQCRGNEKNYQRKQKTKKSRVDVKLIIRGMACTENHLVQAMEYFEMHNKMQLPAGNTIICPECRQHVQTSYMDLKTRSVIPISSFRLDENVKAEPSAESPNPNTATSTKKPSVLTSMLKEVQDEMNWLEVHDLRVGKYDKIPSRLLFLDEVESGSCFVGIPLYLHQAMAEGSAEKLLNLKDRILMKERVIKLKGGKIPCNMKSHRKVVRVSRNQRQQMLMYYLGPQNNKRQFNLECAKLRFSECLNSVRSDPDLSEFREERLEAFLVRRLAMINENILALHKLLENQGAHADSDQNGEKDFDPSDEGAVSLSQGEGLYSFLPECHKPTSTVNGEMVLSPNLSINSHVDLSSAFSDVSDSEHFNSPLLAIIDCDVVDNGSADTRLTMASPVSTCSGVSADRDGNIKVTCIASRDPSSGKKMSWEAQVLHSVEAKPGDLGSRIHPTNDVTRRALAGIADSASSGIDTGHKTVGGPRNDDTRRALAGNTESSTNGRPNLVSLDLVDIDCGKSPDRDGVREDKDSMDRSITHSRSNEDIQRFGHPISTMGSQTSRRPPDQSYGRNPIRSSSYFRSPGFLRNCNEQVNQSQPFTAWALGNPQQQASGNYYNPPHSGHGNTVPVSGCAGNMLPGFHGLSRNIGTGMGNGTNGTGPNNVPNQGLQGNNMTMQGNRNASQPSNYNPGMQGNLYNAGMQGNISNNGLQGNMPNIGEQGNMPNNGFQGNMPNNGLQGNMPNNGMQGNMPNNGIHGNIPVQGYTAPLQNNNRAWQGNVPNSGILGNMPMSGNNPPVQNFNHGMQGNMMMSQSQTYGGVQSGMFQSAVRQLNTGTCSPVMVSPMGVNMTAGPGNAGNIMGSSPSCGNVGNVMGQSIISQSFAGILAQSVQVLQMGFQSGNMVLGQATNVMSQAQCFGNIGDLMNQAVVFNNGNPGNNMMVGRNNFMAQGMVGYVAGAPLNVAQFTQMPR